MFTALQVRTTKILVDCGKFPIDRVKSMISFFLKCAYVFRLSLHCESLKLFIQLFNLFWYHNSFKNRYVNNRILQGNLVGLLLFMLLLMLSDFSKKQLKTGLFFLF